MPNFVCGWCGTLAPTNVLNQYERPHPEGTSMATWEVASCSGCDGLSIFVSGQIVNDPGSQHPRFLSPVALPSPARKIVSLKHVPEGVAADYREAIRCLLAASYKGSVVLSRRATEAICDNRLALLNDVPSRVLDGVLFEKIDHLKERFEITATLAKVAHNVRKFGRHGAHPNDDGLDTVTADDAEQALVFLEHLLNHVYILAEGENSDES